jgi:uncharacterized membrane protein
MTPVPAATDWHIALGSDLAVSTMALLAGAAIVAVLLSGVSLLRSGRRLWALGLLGLRLLGVAACLVVALQPRLEAESVVRLPSHVAVLLDRSRSMSAVPPDGQPARWQRASMLIRDAQPLFDAWEEAGHRIDFYTFGEALTPSSRETLAQTPWADASRIAEALSELRARYAGRDLGAVVVMSDGIDTGRIGPGPLDGETLSSLKALDTPVHTVVVSEHTIRDLSVAALLTDDFAFVRTPIKIEARIRHSGLGGRQAVVALRRDGRLIASQGVALRADASEEKISFAFTPDHPGDSLFEIATPVLPGEALATNNSQVFTLKTIRDRVRVLHVCGRPSWDQRFLRSILSRDPNVDLVSFFILRTESDLTPWNRNDMALIPFPYREIFEEQLRSFDLLIFQNFDHGPYLVGQHLPAVRAYIEAGGALAMIGGDLSFASGGYGASALRDVLPVTLGGVQIDARATEKDLTARFQPELTAQGLTHPVTSLHPHPPTNQKLWATLPVLQGLNRVEQMATGSTALLVHPTLKMKDGKPAPVLALRGVGEGRTLALLTDTAWHWGFVSAGAGTDHRAFERFWKSAIRWLVQDPALTLLRIDLNKSEYSRGQPVVGRVRARHADYTPAPGAEVVIKLVPPGPDSGPPLRSLTLTTDSAGEAHVEWEDLPPGAYRLVGQASLDGQTMRHDQLFTIRPDGHELEDLVSRDGVLRDIAAATGGAFQANTLGDVPVKKPRAVRVGNVDTIEIWAYPWFLLAAMVLLGTEWGLRRRAGLR